jgi:hypothetical protein
LESSGTTPMTDFLYIAVIIAFFALGALYARFCGSI